MTKTKKLKGLKWKARQGVVKVEAMTTNGKLSEEKREEVERKFREVGK